MNQRSFPMGQTENDNFAAASSSTISRPVNFGGQDFNPTKVVSPNKQRSPPCREQSGRPSTPFPESDVQFVHTYTDPASNHPLGSLVLNSPGNGDEPYSDAGAMGGAQPLNPANLCFSRDTGDALHHSQPGPQFFSQQQSWPPESHKLYYSQSLDLENGGLHRTNPFALGQRSASCDASQGSTTPTSPVERDDRVPNSTVRRSRVWKYGRRSSGNHTDRQPFTFSVNASQASGSITGIDQSSTRFFGKRSFSNSRNDDSWSAEPTTKQFISEERMTAEMHNLSLDGVPRQPVAPHPSPSTSPSRPASSPSSSSAHLPSAAAAPNINLPSTSGHSHHGNSSNLLRHHQCHHHPRHHPRSRSYAEVVLANLERRLEDDSDDEGVEEDMPPNQGNSHRLEMTPQLVNALKAKGSSGSVLPQDIVKKIVSSPCMELVLWKPPSIINPRLGPELLASSPPSPSTSGSELAPIMEVEMERERAEAASSLAGNPQPYGGIPGSAGGGGGGMQEGATLPDYDEEMDL